MPCGRSISTVSLRCKKKVMVLNDEEKITDTCNKVE